ncbi:MAG TPA: 16S rRNA (cytosine(1402)-N(4))-methyltransferase RsmH [Candidatus Eisenbacteria bacterium]|nr:16S rRNA (cytosine(1402)-N(4))-methyltransferase RsmH [Candidatus Eisenbacteria bacterium]
MPGHIPVLREEAVRLLVTDRKGIYVDATLGAGGHATAISAAVGEGARVIGLDCDPAAVARATAAPPAEPPRFLAARARFSEMEPALASLGVSKVDGILADLGISSAQLDDPSRGLAFAADGPLDMRLDPTCAETADALIRRVGEEALARLFAELGELPKPRAAARAIYRAAAAHDPLTTRSLRDALASLYPGPARPRRLAQAFQALRMAVNHELEELEALLAAAARVIRPGGTLVVIAYHSLEDRMVKRAFTPPRSYDVWVETPGTPWIPLTKKPERPSADEIARNPRARSAMLRAARRKEGFEC